MEDSFLLTFFFLSGFLLTFLTLSPASSPADLLLGQHVSQAWDSSESHAPNSNVSTERQCLCLDVSLWILLFQCHCTCLDLKQAYVLICSCCSLPTVRTYRGWWHCSAQRPHLERPPGKATWHVLSEDLLTTHSNPFFLSPLTPDGALLIYLPIYLIPAGVLRIRLPRTELLWATLRDVSWLYPNLFPGKQQILGLQSVASKSL